MFTTPEHYKCEAVIQVESLLLSPLGYPEDASNRKKSKQKRMEERRKRHVGKLRVRTTLSIVDLSSLFYASTFFIYFRRPSSFWTNQIN